VELLPLRDSLPPSTRSSSGPPRHLRLLPVLSYVHTQLYKSLFLRPADGLERSTENEDQYMIYDNDPLLTRNIEVPRDMSQLSCMAIFAGVIEAVMDGWGFVCSFFCGTQLVPL
jgi:trafficking protein particle complex subunit 5